MTSPLGSEAERRLRAEILRLLGEYAAEVHGAKPFAPGKTRVQYAGRVFDADEMTRMGGALLDFWLTHGHNNKEFEKEFAKASGARYSLFVNSGSSANLVATSALANPKFKGHLGPGDEVVTPALTFPTTVSPIVQNRLTPVFVDCDPETYNADPDLVAAAVGPRTRAIVIPHTLGNPNDMDRLTELAKDHDLRLMEDCCDALGTRWKGKHVGNFGDVATCSFYPAHHITTGEGGAVFTSNTNLWKVASGIRDWGRDCWCGPDAGPLGDCNNRFGFKMGDLPKGYDHKYIFTHFGYNLKPLDLSGAMGLAQLAKLPDFVRRRNDNFAFYSTKLAKFQEHLILPKALPGAEPSWFAFPITMRDDAPFARRDLVTHLENAFIETRNIFAGNIVRQPLFHDAPKDLYRVHGALTNTDGVMDRGFFIGVYPGLTAEMREYVVATFEAFFSKV